MWICNVSMKHVEDGYHYDPGPNSMLIQIVDPAMEFPKPKHPFREIHQFEFLDLEDGDMPEAEEFKITDDQAKRLVLLLQRAKENKMNVIVHCVAGMCRSGAVAEVGTILGFDDTETPRVPNLMVKRKMLKWVEELDLV